jgi:hypothetical protein
LIPHAFVIGIGVPGLDVFWAVSLRLAAPYVQSLEMLYSSVRLAFARACVCARGGGRGRGLPVPETPLEGALHARVERIEARQGKRLGGGEALGRGAPGANSVVG